MHKCKVVQEELVLAAGGESSLMAEEALLEFCSQHELVEQGVELGGSPSHLEVFYFLLF